MTTVGKIETIHGGIDQQERERSKRLSRPIPRTLSEDFTRHGCRFRESILQNHCSHMIHIEIPYNPNVMEQRNGRIRQARPKREGGFDLASQSMEVFPMKSGLVGHKDDIIRALRKNSMR